MGEQPSLETRQQILADFAATPGTSIDLIVDRTLEAMQRDGLGTSLSAEAMELMHYQMSAWVGSRVMRAHDRTGLMPQTITVTLTVALDTDEF